MLHASRSPVQSRTRASIKYWLIRITGNETKGTFVGIGNYSKCGKLKYAHFLCVGKWNFFCSRWLITYTTRYLKYPNNMHRVEVWMYKKITWNNAQQRWESILWKRVDFIIIIALSHFTNFNCQLFFVWFCKHLFGQACMRCHFLDGVILLWNCQIYSNMGSRVYFCHNVKLTIATLCLKLATFLRFSFPFFPNQTFLFLFHY